ncbi:MAG: hypothetical protein R6W86_09270 [Marinobacter sp.]|uniref:hypothetical protein n=1 Tax=Marinobacter sp. TaxID=50741 RepID=UPI00396D4B74
MKEAVRKAVAAVTGFILALVLLTALLITGFYLLVQAAILSLLPYLGQAGAMAVVGSGCVVLLAAFFWRMTASSSSAAGSMGKGALTTSAIDTLREFIRENPLESAMTAFAVGVVQESDPRLKNLLMQGGMALMKQPKSQDPEEPTTHPSQDDEANRE